MSKLDDKDIPKPSDKDFIREAVSVRDFFRRDARYCFVSSLPFPNP